MCSETPSIMCRVRADGGLLVTSVSICWHSTLARSASTCISCGLRTLSIPNKPVRQCDEPYLACLMQWGRAHEQVGRYRISGGPRRRQNIYYNGGCAVMLEFDVCAASPDAHSLRVQRQSQFIFRIDSACYMLYSCTTRLDVSCCYSGRILLAVLQ